MVISDDALKNSADAVARRVSLRELRLLLAVSRSKNILKAARDIGLTQPAVSKAIADLEETLGVRLFDRNNRGVEPTPHGEILIHHANAVLGEMRQAVEELHSLSDSTRGEVRVGGTPVMCGGLLSRAVATMKAERPGFRYHVTELESERLAAEVCARSIDLGIGRKPMIQADDELAFDKLFDDKLFIVAGAEHPLSKRRTVSLEELADQCWMLPMSQSPITQQVRAMFERAGVDLPQPAVTTMSLLTRFELLATNQFITALHGSLLHFGNVPDFLSVVPVEVSAAVPIGLFRVENRTLTPATELFINNVKRIVRPMNSLSTQRLQRTLGRRLPGVSTTRANE